MPTSTPTGRPTATSRSTSTRALAVERGIAELAITDHVDFDPRVAEPTRRRTTSASGSSRDAAERWAPHGVAIRFGLEVSYESTRRGRDPRRISGARRTTSSSARSTSRRLAVSRRRGSSAGSPADRSTRSSRPYFGEVEAAARSGLFDTIGHLDFVKRYLASHVEPAAFAERLELYEPILRALVETGTALEVNTSGLRQAPRETYPGPAVVARFRELGGERVTIGSDAHRADWFAHGLDGWLPDRGRGRLRGRGVPARRGARGDPVARPVRRE